jgi:peptidyl-tRNA hydrolase
VKGVNGVVKTKKTLGLISCWPLRQKPVVTALLIASLLPCALRTPFAVSFHFSGRSAHHFKMDGAPRVSVAASMPPLPDNTSPDTAAAGDTIPDPSASVGSDMHADADDLVQFIVLRRDLLKTMEWPVGAVVSQACHASLAAVWENQDDADVRAYLSPERINDMHKVTKEVKGEAQLRTLSEKLTQEGILHKLWQEQPENTPTCVALKPYRRSRVAPLLKKYQLFK